MKHKAIFAIASLALLLTACGEEAEKRTWISVITNTQ